MKIGIITYHKANNYGALLQAVALRLYLESKGHEVFYLDYWPSYHDDYYAFFSLRRVFCTNVKSSLSYIRNFLFYFSSRRQRKIKFNIFIKKYIVPYCFPISTTCDMLICGSDQIWRIQPSLKSYNPIYFGVDDLINTKRIVSYAASMGTIVNYPEYNIQLKSLLKDIYKISVREKSLQCHLKSLGFNDVFLSIDPTFLLNQNIWNTLIESKRIIKERYVLFYDLLKNSFQLENIRKFAKSKNLKLIVLHKSASQKENEIHRSSYGPSEFLNLIRYADFVFTSSYHGLIFSLIFERQFIASFSKNAARAEDLLTELKIQDRLIPPMNKLPNELEDIDYTLVNTKLDFLRKESYCYLDSITR